MKMDYDCARDLLLALEELLQYDEKLTIPRLRLNSILSTARMSRYDKGNIVYTTQMLEQAGYIDCRIMACDTNVTPMCWRLFINQSLLTATNILTVLEAITYGNQSKKLL